MDPFNHLKLNKLLHLAQHFCNRNKKQLQVYVEDYFVIFVVTYTEIILKFFKNLHTHDYIYPLQKPHEMKRINCRTFQA